MRQHVTMFMLCSTLISSSAVASSDDLVEKINRLEQQIQELKALKEQKKIAAEKEDQCRKAIGSDRFCKCLADGLPSDISFEQYIHIIVNNKYKLEYEILTPAQRISIDKTLDLRNKCIDKGLFK